MKTKETEVNKAYEAMCADLNKTEVDETYEAAKANRPSESNYWARYYERLDACKTQAECDALRDAEYYEKERKLYAENNRINAENPERNNK